MAERSHVPAFGNWESEENVPYTAYFDNARKGRNAGKITNPNDPQENPKFLSDSAVRGSPSRAKADHDEPVGLAPVGRVHGRHRSREDSELKQFAESPARNDNMHRRASGDSTPSRYGRGVSSGETPKRPTRHSTGSEYSMERSPLHPHARVAGRGIMTSPAREGKASHDSGHGTLGRSKMRPRGNESPDKGAAVPKFGDWNENDPASADGYTHIFNKVREERNSGGRAGTGSEQSSYPTIRKPTNNSSKGCCFPWLCK
ncbi:hypothetical protein SLEP1_g42356 [Rubroshorea leprosula]|uniref:RIN4 pathogenic type III effector avirulence factor Avr cleavage site domain-containing protein n=1 Tax=Rubroshorea leprosula TaxID=152421 RepID=A0AAV5L9J3_9ROSI|nr:hypothetical protein SLEP1_g42356 [Rubroshorea leprosula]